jgi:serine/threonine protein kinase
MFTLNASSTSVAISLESDYYVWGKFDAKYITSPLRKNFSSSIDFSNFEFGDTYKTIELFDNDFLPIKRYNKYFDEFEESKLIASGSFGIVCKAIDKKDKIFYAIKKIPIERNEINVIRRELEIMIKLKSHYIVEYKFSWIEKNYFDFKNFENNCNTNGDITSCHQIFHPKNTHLLHIQMELCLKTLNEVIAKLKIELNSKEFLNFQSISYYMISEVLNEILECVDFLHKKNIIHRDLKPANILITDGINGKFIKLADFGLTIIHEMPDQSHTQGSGTYKYMAPEVKNTRKYDTKADIFSLGVITQELFQIKSEMCAILFIPFIVSLYSTF